MCPNSRQEASFHPLKTQNQFCFHQCHPSRTSVVAELTWGMAPYCMSFCSEVREIWTIRGFFVSAANSRGWTISSVSERTENGLENREEVCYRIWSLTGHFHTKCCTARAADPVCMHTPYIHIQYMYSLFQNTLGIELSIQYTPDRLSHSAYLRSHYKWWNLKPWMYLLGRIQGPLIVSWVSWTPFQLTDRKINTCIHTLAHTVQSYAANFSYTWRRRSCLLTSRTAG